MKECRNTALVDAIESAIAAMQGAADALAYRATVEGDSMCELLSHALDSSASQLRRAYSEANCATNCNEM